MNIPIEIVENWQHFEIQIKEQVNKIKNLHISVNTNKDNKVEVEVADTWLGVA